MPNFAIMVEIPGGSQNLLHPGIVFGASTPSTRNGAHTTALGLYQLFIISIDLGSMTAASL